MASLISKDTSGVFVTQPDETEVERTRSFKKWSLPDAPDGGKRSRVAGQTGPIHYRLDPFSASEEFKEIDLDILLTPGGSWDASCETNGFQVRFWQSRIIAGKTVRYIAQFRRGGKWVSIAPLALIYTNAAGQKQLIARPQNVAPVIDNDAYTVTWPNAFGTNMDFRYNLRPDDFFKTVIFRGNPRILVPPTISLTGLRVVLVMGVAWDASVSASNSFAAGFSPTELDGDDLLADLPDETVSPANEFSIKDDLHDYCWLQKPRGWDSSVDADGNPAEKEIALQWSLRRKGNAAFALLGASGGVFNAAGTTYPVYMDTAIGEEQVGASADDAYEYGGAGTWPGRGTATRTGATQSLAASGFFFFCDGWIFDTVPIPQGATIDSASVSVKCSQTQSTTPLMRVYGDDHDTSALWPTGTNTNVDTGSAGYRTRTSNYDSWEPPSWTLNTWYTSTDVATPVEQVVGRAGWASNNRLGIIITNDSATLPQQTQSRNVYAYDQTGNVSGPKFNCSYTEGGGAPAAAAFVPRHIWGPGFAEGWGIR